MSTPNPFDPTSRFVPRSRSGLGQLFETALSGGEIRRRAQAQREAFALEAASRQALADERRARAAISQDELTSRGEIEAALIADGTPAETARLLASITRSGQGASFSSAQQGRLRGQELDFRSQAQEAIAGGQTGLGNSFLSALSSGPQSSVRVQGGQIIRDQFGDEPVIAATPGELASVAARQAQARAADARAAASGRRNPVGVNSPEGGLTVQQALTLRQQLSGIRSDRLTEIERGLLAAAEQVLSGAAGIGRTGPVEPPDSVPSVQATTPSGQESPLLTEARDAIARGADPEAVRQRLRELGIDPGTL